MGYMEGAVVELKCHFTLPALCLLGKVVGDDLRNNICYNFIKVDLCLR